jgi:hypothetical protein
MHIMKIVENNKQAENNAYNEDNMKEAVEPAKKAVAVI